MQLPDFSKANILVVGDLMLDRYWTGQTGRISPEAPVPVVKIDGSEDRPGGAANVAFNAAALGANIRLLGLTGDDESSDLLAQKLCALGVQCDFIKLPEYDTITKLRVLSRNQQLIRLDFERSFAAADTSLLLQKFADRVSNVDLVVLSDYNKGTLHDAAKFIELAKMHKVPVIVDPKGTDFSKYAGATLITPNMAEFQAIVGECDDELTIVKRAQQLAEKLSLEALLVTRSEQGMTLLQSGEQEIHFPAKAKEVYDVTGAGDTVISTLAVSVAAGASWSQATALANAAASVVVGKLGTSTVSASELAHAVSGEKTGGRGVMSEQQLAIAIDVAKQHGQKVVMTNGCFDILHAGHVSYLSNASELGDKLIVAVNNDDSVTRLKGKGRPINHLDRRMAVLAGLASVDWVVAFTEDTPERIISQLLPDVLVKGCDYKVEDIAGGQQVIENGGEVKVLNFEDGVSTTGMINNIMDKQNS
jgi:D-beta-D-heptose 7-phosphate kinase/D-beta-D-heptose 1-phosphate adenosyltransferase